jgi:hypothetical protein
MWATISSSKISKVIGSKTMDSLSSRSSRLLILRCLMLRCRLRMRCRTTSGREMSFGFVAVSSCHLPVWFGWPEFIETFEGELTVA